MSSGPLRPFSGVTGSSPGGIVTGPRVGFWLYLVTDGVPDPRAALVSPMESRLTAALSAVPQGMVAVQLRAKNMDGGPLFAAAERLRQLTRRFGAPFFVNDRVDVALAVGADGVHLPQAGLPVKAARRLCGARLSIGVSTHSIPEARMAVAGGADFVTYGPVWPTPSKPPLDVTAFPPDPAAPGRRLVAPVGVDGLADVVVVLPVPVFALGGVDCVDRVRQCVSAGARVACLRAVLGAPDPAVAAREIIQVMLPENDRESPAVGARGAPLSDSEITPAAAPPSLPPRVGGRHDDS